MPNNLTEADEAKYLITYRTPGDYRGITAAYVTTEDKHPDMLAFKDHKNRTVLLVSREAVLAVERLEQTGGCADSGTAADPGAAAISQYWTGLLPGTAAGFGLTRITCKGCDRHVAVECGDVTGMTPGDMIEAAGEQARRDCPEHETIRIGQR